MTKTKQTRVAAYAIIVHESKLLLCRLTQLAPGQDQPWTLPGGGLDFGESPKEAVLREVFEETGLQVSIENLLSVDSELSHVGNTQLHSIRILYQASYLGGDFRYELNGSTDKCGWFTGPQTDSLSMVDVARIGVQLAFV